MEVTRIVEKPAPEEAPSRLGVAGRYILTPGVFDEIRNQPRGVGGEIQLTDGIAALLRREKVFAYTYEGKRYDCGSKEGFLQANVELALAHPEVGAEIPRVPEASTSEPGRSAVAPRQLRTRSAAVAAQRRRSTWMNSSPTVAARPARCRSGAQRPGSRASSRVGDDHLQHSPLAMSVSAFFAFRIGSGQLRPRVSISLWLPCGPWVESDSRSAASASARGRPYP